MLIPFSHELTEEQRYKKRFLSSLNKAKHLSERMKQFINDIDKTKTLKPADKKKIKEEVLKFLNSQK